MFAPKNPGKKKQTIIMVKETLPFISPNHDRTSNNDQLIKGQLEAELAEYCGKFEEFRIKKLQHKKADQEKKARDWTQQLRTKGFLFWAEDITFKGFHDNNQKVMIGAFHLSSKVEIGQL